MIHRKPTERGQALILIALAAVVLFAFAALAIDGSRAFSDKRHAQNAADTAVLAAALKYIRQPGSEAVKYTAAQSAAEYRAAQNGYLTNWTSIIVDVDRCDSIIDYDLAGHEIEIPGDRNAAGAIVGCEGAPAPSDQGSKEYIRVKIISRIPATFGRVIGRDSFTSAVEAIARVQTSTSPSSGAFSSGAAMVTTRGGNYNQCFLVNGGADLYTHGSGIFVNCSGSQAMFMNGGATVEMDAQGQIVGCYGANGGATFDPFSCNVNGGTSQVFDASTFASVPTMPTPPTCSSAGSQTSTKLTPGYFNGNVTINNDTTMDPGTYCFNGGININGQNKLNGPTGSIKVVLGNNDFNLGVSNFTFNDLAVYTVNGSFRANGNGVLNTDRLRFYSSGSGNFQINGNGGVTSNNAYIYLKGGQITWNGNSTVNLHAAPASDPEGVGGLLVYMPWSNTTPITFNGGSNIHLTGTCLMPHSNITFNGGVNFELHSQIVGYQYIVNGGGAVDIYYVASENYNPPAAANPTIQLTK